MKIILFLFVVSSSFVLFVVNDLVTKYKLQKVGSAKRRCFSNEGQRLIDAVTAASDEGKRERSFIIFMLS